jgi:hypothetical protein
MTQDAITTIRIEGGKANAMTSDLLTIRRSIDDFEHGPRVRP